MSKRVVTSILLLVFWGTAGIGIALGQNYAGYWLGVTYPSDPNNAIFNYFGNFTQSGATLGGTAQTANPKVAFGGLAYVKGSVTATTVKFKESESNGSLNTPLTCYWSLDLKYDPVEESLKGTYSNILNPPYCDEEGGGKVELYRIVLKSGNKYCKGQSINLTVTGKNIRWYDSANKGKLLAQGNNFSPKIAQTTTFYITQTLYNTESPAIPIKIEIVDMAISDMQARNPSCGQANGQITVLATGSDVLQYSIDGTNYQTGNVFGKLSGGEFTVSIKDAAGCAATKKATLTQSGAAKIATATASPTTCGKADGGITVTTAAANAQFSIDGNKFQPGADFRNLAAGNYTVTMRDAAGCTDTRTATVVGSEGPALSNVSLSPVSCGVADGVISVQAKARTAMQYALNGGNYGSRNSFENLAVGDYEIAVRDAENCVVSRKVTMRSDCANTIFVPTSFSPNGDGQNDQLTVHFPFPSLQFSSLRVYNRWGIAVHGAQNLALSNGDAIWDGKLDGQTPLTENYYVVVAEVKFEDGSTHTFRKEVVVMQ